MVIFTWVTLLVLQVGQESLAFRKQLSAVDYDVRYENPHHSNSIRSVDSKNSSVHRLPQNINNGRQPKGIDIALPATEKWNSTTEHFSPSHPTSLGRNNNQKSLLPPSSNATNTQAKEQVTIDSLPSQIGLDSLQLLKNHMFQLNQKQRIRNADKFPPLAQDGIVLIVQVHRREGYLRQLFNSLRNVRGIEKVLLVISHDYYYDDVMQLVQSVDFCRVCVVSTFQLHNYLSLYKSVPNCFTRNWELLCIVHCSNTCNTYHMMYIVVQ